MPDIQSMRSTLEFLEQEGELLRVNKEVDTLYEIAGIQKSFENGSALLFENIKGFPGVRSTGNVYSRIQNVAKMFGLDDHRKLKFKIRDAINAPLPPKVVSNAPCQEVVITDNIDVNKMLPIITHTPKDAGPILGGGILYGSGPLFKGGSDISFKRMHFRGKDWGTVLFARGTQLGEVVISMHDGEDVPLTVNIGVSPAIAEVAGGGFHYDVTPVGTDQVAIAGGIQGFPIEICKAKTVDAYSLADAEWVIEGYINSKDRRWESDEAERVGIPHATRFFPEYTRYFGKAFKMPVFHVTGITHRKNPIFHTPLADSFEDDFTQFPFMEACIYEIAERWFPGLCIDVHILNGQVHHGIVLQVKKTRKSDEGLQRLLIMKALTAQRGNAWVICVDEDIDIYNAEEVLWALTTRIVPGRDIMVNPSGGGLILFPAYTTKGTSDVASAFNFAGSLGFDATVPWEQKWGFERADYPVNQVDLKKWFSEEQIAKERAKQSEYARVLAEHGW
ncbi:UbiD family decarboxylase domain-containing protein [Chloroflexota bacterium]